MGEDICYSYIRKGVNVEDIKIMHTTQHQKKNKQTATKTRIRKMSREPE